MNFLLPSWKAHGFAAAMVVGAVIALSEPAMAYSGGASHMGAMHSVPIGGSELHAPAGDLHPYSASPVRVPAYVSSPTVHESPRLPGVAPSVRAPVTEAPHAASATAGGKPAPANSVNPVTCDPATSAQCAREVDEFGDGETASTPTPPAFQQPVPSPPVASQLPAPAPVDQTDAASAAMTEQQPTELSSGGTARQDDPHFGGGDPSLADCMSIWEPATDMSKAEWKATCIRTLNGIDLPTEGVDTAPARRTHQTVAGAARKAPASAKAASNPTAASSSVTN